jgi:polysaccharide deacetylase family protein (PEP-CTERM system associated)
MLEDYFHVAAFNGLIQRSQWDRFETRLENNTLRALDLLDRFDIKATFFVLGWVADRQPELIKEVARRGHELGNRGLYQRSTRRMTADEFRDDLKRSRDAVERASETKVVGYRAARRWSSPEDLWPLDILAEQGYAYDCSLVPLARGFNREPWRCFAHQHQFEEKRIWEFPISTCSFLGWRIPIAGGNYFRQFPHTLLKHVVEHWHKTYDAPFVMYTHVWELDPEQPRISSASFLTKIRQYRNLDKMAWVLEDYFRKYRFVGMADYLGLGPMNGSNHATEPEAMRSDVDGSLKDCRPVLHLSSVSESHVAAAVNVHRTPVTIIVPCFNEELILPYLANTLRSVETTLKSTYELHFIFVDDGSTDGTFKSLQSLFGAWPNCAFLRHEENLGVAASILDGIRHAATEIVCSIDCDCTYDPHELSNMIPLLADDVDLVTASPYHPQGRVRNVPAWRLSLSKGASFLYRHVLSQRLYTYTSCFRVYRREAMVNLRVLQTGFLGIPEMLGKLDLRGAKIVEYPATLEVRLFGHSKMKVLKTIAGHLRLMVKLLALRATAHEAPGQPVVEAESQRDAQHSLRKPIA